MIVTACGRKSPTLNPFDEVFDVEVSQLAELDCDTVSAGCGYFNLVYHKEDHDVYYQVYMDEGQVIAKGLTILVDSMTLDVRSQREIDDNSAYQKRKSELDRSIADSVLASYGLSKVDPEPEDHDWSWVYSDEQRSTYSLTVQESWLPEMKKMIWEAKYFESKPSALDRPN